MTRPDFNELFFAFAPPPACPACDGSGTQVEDKDGDSRMLTRCDLCHGTRIRDAVKKPPTSEDRQRLAERGRQLKRQGQERVGDRPEARLVNRAFDHFLKHRRWDSVQADSMRGNGVEPLEFTAADLRVHAACHFSDEAEWQNLHPNSWGAAFHRFAHRGDIEQTGRYEASHIPSHHGRKLPVWSIRPSLQNPPETNK